MDIREQLKGTKCPITYTEMWGKYDQYLITLNVVNILDYQGIEWRPYASEIHNQPIQVFPGSDNNAVVYIRDLGTQALSSMVILDKGQIKWVEHYDCDFKPDVNTHGSLYLKLAGLVTTGLKKLTGVITITSINENIIGVSLMPDFDYINNHGDMTLNRNIHKLYTQNNWSGPIL